MQIFKHDARAFRYAGQRVFSDIHRNVQLVDQQLIDPLQQRAAAG